MTTAKKLGIWMDDSNAHLIEFVQDPIEKKTIELNFTQKVEESNLMHNRNMLQQDEHLAFCKALAEIVKGYQEVVLFGPAKTKAILYNMLLEDDCFDELKLDIQLTNTMASSEQHHFVSEYFSRRGL